MCQWAVSSPSLAERNARGGAHCYSVHRFNWCASTCCRFAFPPLQRLHFPFLFYLPPTIYPKATAYTGRGQSSCAHMALDNDVSASALAASH
ncbi:hypothetical protein PsYK624_116850 [Phanerochaete sordida]|uniref:Uncharacterized protein n=1 Tax=Phanerochaete sordida TaxID=48140 RepID=A0A9P3LHM9_9APHY|nr:hypothetical protein PsYK624_116850 [Phanerochaete sordida]